MFSIRVCDDADTELRDEQEGSILSSLISQLRFVYKSFLSREVVPNEITAWLPFCRSGAHRIGMDLHRVAFPTFVLEPRSMLERIADFMAHPDLVFGYVPSS